MQNYAWCFTLNNPTPEETKAYGDLVGADQDRGGPTYICWGEEKGANGTPHLQGYVEFDKRKRLKSVKSFMGERVHLEPRKGTQEQAIAYCKKDGVFVSFGVSRDIQQGHRADIDAAVDELRTGKRLQDLALEQPTLYCKYRNGLRDIARWAAKARDEPPTVIFIHGPPGTGKSKYAFGLDPTSCWSYAGDGWFDGYDGHRVAIFDDFADDLARPGERAISYGLFLKLLDRYPLDVPVKGGFTAWKPATIIITSNRRLEAVYVGCHAYVWEAIQRRVTEIKEME